MRFWRADSLVSCGRKADSYKIVCGALAKIAHARVTRDSYVRAKYSTFDYGGTSPQRPPWVETKVAVVERWPLKRGLNKS